MKRTIAFMGVLILILSSASISQTDDYVDVTFYYKPQGNPSEVHIPGQFNGWQNTAQVSLMTLDPTAGVWSKTIQLKINPNNTGISDSYQYKFWDPVNGWVPDPLNPRQNPLDNNNSIITPKSPTIYQMVPSSKSGIVSKQRPVFSAYVFRSQGSAVDTSSFFIRIDTTTTKIPGTAYDPILQKLSFLSPSPLRNGMRPIKLMAKNLAGAEVFDTTSIFIQAGAIQIQNQSGYTTRKSAYLIRGVVEDTSIHAIGLCRNGTDTLYTTALNGAYSLTMPLVDGMNSIVAFAKDSTNTLLASSPFDITRFIDHTPKGKITFGQNDNTISALAVESSDPDSGQSSSLKYLWSLDTTNPESIAGINGATSATISFSKPTIQGEYYFQLIVTDADNQKDTTRNYFTIDRTNTIQFPGPASIPNWARQGRIYELFFNSFTPERTISAATKRLDYLKALGVNILWLMPIMKNNAHMDNGSGVGYNIVDFLTVAPEYGTNAEFKEFVDQAHLRGLKVILDITPNHTSSNHPFVKDARLFRENSFYWNFYQHSPITHNTNGLGQSLTPDGFVYYSGFSDQLLNYNWSDIDARAYMIDIFLWWVKQMGVDGYRFDVYWGPHRRENNGIGGETDMGIPVRNALKHIKPDIYLLAEDDGTGSGTEMIFADRSGGVDGGYDWRLYGNAIKPFSFYNVDNLNQYITNFGGNVMGFVPGPNSSFLRFLENHDEERISYVYGSYEKTKPMATVVFTAPGMPMIYSGQEIGWGLGVSNYDQRRRGVLDWTNVGKDQLLKHYQKLAWIRSKFPALSTQAFTRLTTGSSLVYGYARPYSNENALVLTNFSESSQTTTVTLIGAGTGANISFAGGVINGKRYYVSDVFNDSSASITFNNDLATLTAVLSPFNSAVYIISDTTSRLVLPDISTGFIKKLHSTTPITHSLEQNYPNPFNPKTAIRFSLPSVQNVCLKVFDVLGREVATLLDEVRDVGTYQIDFDGTQLPSGVYYYTMKAGNNALSRKMLLAK